MTLVIVILLYFGHVNGSSITTNVVVFLVLVYGVVGIRFSKY